MDDVKRALWVLLVGVAPTGLLLLLTGTLLLWFRYLASLSAR
jgi:hypothetical protein